MHTPMTSSTPIAHTGDPSGIFCESRKDLLSASPNPQPFPEEPLKHRLSRSVAVMLLTVAIAAVLAPNAYAAVDSAALLDIVWWRFH
ncbi:hypothetical protein GCM10010171_61110 [Actinokineospora fastidiosa]|uniref:Uncharacterized protein n=1 Tax=Actinokineospora fastidiosa TaxID=1816 RepID=A0A918LJW7_9PSEU|nr:hypothetical protein GCM10010171_61110 [Actinokineospora fastidiosa]